MADSTLGFAFRVGKYGSDEPGTFRYPSAAAVLPSGEVVVTDSWNSRLQVMVLNCETGEMEVSAIHNFNAGVEPYGVTVMNGRVFVSVQGFGATPHGVFEFSWSDHDPAKPVEADAKGKKKGTAPTAIDPKRPPQLWAVNFFGGKVDTKDGAFAYPCGLAVHSPSECILVADRLALWSPLLFCARIVTINGP